MDINNSIVNGTDEDRLPYDERVVSGITIRKTGGCGLRKALTDM